MTLVDLYTQQLLWGEKFLQQFSEQLRLLYDDSEFMGYIESIQRSITVPEDTDNIETIKCTAKTSMYELNAAHQFAALGSIVTEVANAKCAKNSAYISVYLSMRIFALSEANAAITSPAREEPPSAKPNSEFDFRLRWPAEYRCDDGHYVRSKNEMLVDNWLYGKGICHAYEKVVFSCDQQYTYCSDFYIPSRKMFIEIWGMDNAKYLERRKRKTDFYKEHGHKLLEISGDDVKNLDDKLSAAFSTR